jgi:hypothetical protein
MKRKEEKTNWAKTKIQGNEDDLSGHKIVEDSLLGIYNG